ncbi:MAG TPA: twin-arginine translocation signal domain-containing protein, partial [Paraburkholderia sp.]
MTAYKDFNDPPCGKSGGQPGDDAASCNGRTAQPDHPGEHPGVTRRGFLKSVGASGTAAAGTTMLSAAVLA